MTIPSADVAARTAAKMGIIGALRRNAGQPVDAHAEATGSKMDTGVGDVGRLVQALFLDVK